jgi:hypothetical protein
MSDFICEKHGTNWIGFKRCPICESALPQPVAAQRCPRCKGTMNECLANLNCPSGARFWDNQPSPSPAATTQPKHDFEPLNGSPRTCVACPYPQDHPAHTATTQPEPKPAPQADKPKQIATFERIAETYNDSPIDSTVHHLCIEVMKWREWYRQREEKRNAIEAQQ